MLETYWAELLHPQDPLLQIRQKGWDRFQEIGLPLPKQEAFQYLTKKLHFPRLALRKNETSFNANDIVFVDGFFEETLSKITTPLVCLPIEKAIRSYGLFLQTRMAKILSQEKDPFAALNGAFQGRGVFLYIPPKCKAVLKLHQIYTAEEMASPRLHIFVGRDAELSLTQTFQGKSGFSNQLIDCVLDNGSKLSVIDQSEGDFQALRATLKRDSQLKMVSLGHKLRNSMQVELEEENCEAELYGLSHLSSDEQAHVHVHMEHKAPHTRSKQHFKSVLKEKSRFSFEGKIYVHPIAQKTEAYQLNNNLILSDDATANAKPNLEIFADDVKASHGATVGQLDKEALFYLRSRGLDQSEAKDWLIGGFCKEILDHAT